ncbi:25528_t:CDS:2, partial [Dentiscutata erythropus]
MLPPLKSLQSILSNEKSCINYLIEKGVLDSQSICNLCSSLAKRYEKVFKYRRKQCRISVSIFKDIFFSKRKLKVNEILQIGYYWLAKTPHISIKNITGHSPNTITYYANCFKALVGLNLQETQDKIRGPEIIVEIDKTKIGKRKYNHGHHVK